MKRWLPMVVLMAMTAAHADAPAPDRGYELIVPVRHVGNGRCAFRPDHKIVACEGYGKVTLWRLPEREMVGRIKIDGSKLTSLAWSPDGKLLAAASDARQVQLAEPRSGQVWRLDDWGQSLEPVGESVLAFHPEGSKLVAATPSGRILVWDTTTRSLLGSLPTGQQMTALGFSQNGRLLVTTGSHAISAWQWPELKPLSKAPLTSDAQSHPRLAVLNDRVGISAAQQFQAMSLPHLTTLESPDPVTSHGLATDGSNWLISGSQDIPECDHLATGGRWLAASGDQTQVEIIDRQNGHKFHLTGETLPVSDLSFRNNTLALAVDDGVTIWPLASPQPTRTLPADRSWRILPKLSPQADHLAIADQQQISIYHTASGELLVRYPLKPPMEAADLHWTADGQRLKVPLRRNLTSSEAAQPRLLQIDLKPRNVQDLPPQPLVPVLGPHGPTGFLTADDGTVKLIDTATSTLLGTLALYPNGWIYLQPDGRYDATPGIQAKVVRQGRVHSLSQLSPTPGLFLRVARGERPAGEPVAEPETELQL